MAVLLAVLYERPKAADRALQSVENLIAQGHIDIEDACTVRKDEDGEVTLHQHSDLSVLGGVAGFVFGTIAGFIVLMPYLGLPAAVVGAAAAKGCDRGINDKYMRDLSLEMPPCSSALFILVRNTPIETILEEIAPHGGRIFHTSLTPEQEEEVRQKFVGYENKPLKPQEYTQELF
jgi:uncharacterized membrane protein